jgi:serine/threonine-protein kinase HipA
MSLSLPLAMQTHPDDRVRPFLQGLLPDNAAVVKAWGKRFQVSPGNPFDVLKHVGEDCAGALQFVRPERLELILSGGLDSLIPLSDEDLMRRIDDLNLQARSIPVQIEGRFSLAGAQTKDALHLKDGRWFVPAGRIPSTHILKPELDDYDHYSVNEHFCLQLAAKIGLVRAESRVLEIAGKRVLCVKRYDRTTDASGNVVRWHQEDTCQALGKGPQQKYQSDGGPSAAEIVQLLDQFSDDRFDDISRFIMALALNWVIAGTDAHSKNYSILHAPGSFTRLAPLYDIASYLPYQRDLKSTKAKLAMKIGGTYRLHQIDGGRWRKWSDEAGQPFDRVKSTILTLIDKILRHVVDVGTEVEPPCGSPFVRNLVAAIKTRATACGECME